MRPRKYRHVMREPEATYFKPRGIPMKELEEIVLTVEELEAMHLVDEQDLDQIQAAEKMSISQPTLHRLLQTARKKIAEAMYNGKAIKIEGGNYLVRK